jgi:hypothetical protein
MLTTGDSNLATCPWAWCDCKAPMFSVCPYNLLVFLACKIWTRADQSLCTHDNMKKQCNVNFNTSVCKQWPVETFYFFQFPCQTCCNWINVLCVRTCHLKVSAMAELDIDIYLIRGCNLQLVKYWQVDQCHGDADKCLWTHDHGVLSSIHIHLSWKTQKGYTWNVTVGKQKS